MPKKYISSSNEDEEEEETTCPNNYRSSSDEDEEEEESEEGGAIAQLANALSTVTVKDDIEMYNQLKFQHSKVITGFRSTSACWDCFISKYNLNRDIVRNLYTQNSVFRKLNVSLCQDSKEPFVKMYSQLLAEAIYEAYQPLPNKVYRGVKFSERLGRRYKRNVGEIIYIYSFTSASISKDVANSFRGPDGWMITILLEKGNRNCVADVHEISDFPSEKEVLISANAGFKICSVDQARKQIVLQLVDESKCLTTKPAKCCKKHKAESP
jgi:hypothetical protein